jgi:hypothetical protein
MPAMTDIPEYFPTEFGTNWDHQCQQKMSKLSDLVTIDKVRGKEKTGNKIGPSEMTRVVTRAGDTNITDIDLEKRWLRPYPHEKADLFDEWDQEFLGDIALPNSETIQSHAMAYGRTLDKTIIEAAVGTAYNGETGTNGVVLPSTQKVAVNYVESGGTTNSGLTIAKLRAAKFIFDDNEVDEDDNLTIAVSAKQLQDLLQTTQVTSSDFNSVKALVNGTIDTFMGFKFKRVSKSFFAYNSGTDVRNIVAFAKSGIRLSDAGRKVHVDVRVDKSHSLQIRTVASIGGARWDEKKVVEIACDESP